MTHSISDKENDRAMLEVVGSPVVMENGNPEIKKIVNATNEGSNTFQTVRESLEWSNNIPAYHLYQDVLISVFS